ncbi:MAG TPA: PH domain-containing protein [Pseudoneobacillus sp.]|nr:PH domain-containing protein [Pseudoneobacillus sp.]
MDTKDEAIKNAGFGRKWAVRSIIEQFERSLRDEKMLGIAISFHNPKNQLFITDKRVILRQVKGPTNVEMVDILLKNITSFQIKQGMLKSKIEIRSSNQKIDIDDVLINISEEMISILRNAVDRAS